MAAGQKRLWCHADAEVRAWVDCLMRFEHTNSKRLPGSAASILHDTDTDIFKLCIQVITSRP